MEERGLEELLRARQRPRRSRQPAVPRKRHHPPTIKRVTVQLAMAPIAIHAKIPKPPISHAPAPKMPGPACDGGAYKGGHPEAATYRILTRHITNCQSN